MCVWWRWVLVALRGPPLFTVNRGLLLAAMCGPLMVAASLWWAERLQQLRLVGSGAVALIDFCFPARGIFPDQGLNLRLLDWQAGDIPSTVSPAKSYPFYFIYF